VQIVTFEDYPPAFISLFDVLIVRANSKQKNIIHEILKEITEYFISDNTFRSVHGI
jgi:hypothetical protein